MNVQQTIEKRRAFRILGKLDVTDDLIEDLASSASLAPSCYNNQPWRFVFVHEKKKLENVFSALPKGNSWMKAASLIIAVFTKKDLDCVLKNREYFLFDTGIATGFLMLRATELGLIAHPAAGFDDIQIKKLLNIPEDCILITLIAVGKIPVAKDAEFADSIKEAETPRSERLTLTQFAYTDEVL